MFAKPNEIGSAESLTAEIENVAGSLRLNVALPFEARRYEFSLPAGEETLDGSNEDEVPVLRRVIDTHAGEVIRTTSLPTVIKEVLIARFGGVRSGSEWFSARATLESAPTLPAKPEWFPDAGEPETVGATDEEVRNAIEEFEASNEAPVMTDGGEVVSLMPEREREELSERESVILSAIEEAVEEVAVVTTDRLKFWPAGEYDSDSPDLVALSGEYPEVPAAPEFDIPGKPAYRVREEFDAALIEALPAGIEFEHLGGMVTGFYGSPEVMTDGGRDIEVTEEKYGDLSAECPECGFEFRRSSNPEDMEEPEHHGEDGVRDAVERHLEICSEFEPVKVRATGYVFDRIQEYQGEFQGTRSFLVGDAMRRQKTNIVIISPEEAEAVINEFTCYDWRSRTWMTANQGEALNRVRSEILDAMDERGFEVGGRGRFGEVKGFHRPEPETDGGEEPEVMTDGGSDLPRTLRENLIENGNKAVEEIDDLESSCSDCGETFNVAELYWFNRQTFRCSDCHPEVEVMTDGGSRVHPDDEGVEILDSENDDDSDIIDAGDDGIIMTDGGRPVREEEEFRTLMEEYNPEEWNPEPDPDYYRSGEVSIHDPIEGEAYSEPGHWANRPPDMDAAHARRLALRGEFDDLDEHQPLPLLSSDMRGVPTEGVQGSFSEVVELSEPCPECSQCWGIRSVVTMAGVGMTKCLICEHVIEQG